MDEEIKKEITPEGETVIVCIGSELRGDDGLGPYVGARLKAMGQAEGIRHKAMDQAQGLRREGEESKFEVINAFSVIENYLQKIISSKPRKLIIVDAAFFGGNPGEMKILPPDKLSSYKIVSTHSFPLEVLLGIIKEDLPDLKIVILGVQPENIDYKEGLSPDAKASAGEIIAFFNSL